MLKPRKQKRLQFVVITSGRFRQIVSGRLYVGKRRSPIIAWSNLSKCASTMQAMLEDRYQTKGDFFQQKKPYRDVFRVLKAKWVLSWVVGRDELFFLRKFPRPKPRMNYDAVLDILDINGSERQRLKPMTEEESKRILGNWFTMDEEKSKLLGSMVDRDVEQMYLHTTLPVRPETRDLYERLKGTIGHRPAPLTVLPHAIIAGNLNGEEVFSLDTEMLHLRKDRSHEVDAMVHVAHMATGDAHMRAIKSRKPGEGEMFLIDSLSQHPDAKQEFNMNTNSPYDSLYKDDKDA